ncbi:calcium-binding EGF-like domain-containing protein [Candidatus Bathyarchaeota archaeon]|nr:calcium-binding EGF-like domain-containing protein [Candidatus Bathyarchaeota archaeon]
MLAAFPPPAQATSRASRVGSWFRNSVSWPLPQDRQVNDHAEEGGRSRGGPGGGKGKRKYCGLPLWGIILVVLVVLAIIAAAIFVPLQFFVFNNNNGPLGNPELEKCRSEMQCENGGTNVVTQGACSCICTNGFTGSECTDEGSSGCTTTRLVNMDDNPDIDDVTMGQAIPRLITEAEGNFSVPLSGTAILARFNMGSLSCTAQNSLVTFDGRSGGMGSGGSGAAQAAIQEKGVGRAAAVQVPTFVSISVITVFPLPARTANTYAFRTIPKQDVHSVTSGTTTTTATATPKPSPEPPASAPAPNKYNLKAPASFSVNEEVLDFARVAVLFILQEDGVAEASRAQSVLERFFTDSEGKSRPSADKAMNVDLGNGNAVDLVNFRVDAGTGVMGEGDNAKRALDEGLLRWGA